MQSVLLNYIWIHVTEEKHQLNSQTVPAVCTISTSMAVKLKKVVSNLLSMQGMLTGDQVVTQAMLGKGVKALGTWIHKLKRQVDKWVRKYPRHDDFWST